MALIEPRSEAMIRRGRGPDTDWLGSRTRGAMASRSVLVHSPSFAFQAPGGGENQLVQTSKHLESIGIPIRPFSPWTDRLEDARLIHLFGMSREGLELARVARSLGVPVVLSPICWFEPKAMAALAPSRGRAALALGAWASRTLIPGLPGWRRELLGIAAAILPNSGAEARQLVRLFGADRAKIHVVPNGVDPRFAEADSQAFRAIHGGEEFVLYVGRIELRKNVLSLIRGARLAGLPLVILGAVVPGQESYGAACRREGHGVATFIERLDHDDPLLASAMAAAKVFALPSWFETPGLAALEAAMAGSAVAITPHGCTREYFEDRVVYAPPGDVRGIALALTKAWDDGPDPSLAGHIAANYTWSVVAIATREAYDRVAS